MYSQKSAPGGPQQKPEVSEDGKRSSLQAVLQLMSFAEAESHLVPGGGAGGGEAQEEEGEQAQAAPKTGGLGAGVAADLLAMGPGVLEEIRGVPTGAEADAGGADAAKADAGDKGEGADGARAELEAMAADVPAEPGVEADEEEEAEAPEAEAEAEEEAEAPIQMKRAAAPARRRRAAAPKHAPEAAKPKAKPRALGALKASGGKKKPGSGKPWAGHNHGYKLGYARAKKALTWTRRQAWSSSRFRMQRYEEAMRSPRDGVLDMRFVQDVAHFQFHHKLAVDGKIGPTTHKYLIHWLKSHGHFTKLGLTRIEKKGAVKFNQRFISRPRIAQMRKLLGIPPRPAVIGWVFLKRILAFQRENGLDPSGKLTRKTMTTIVDVKAISASSSNSAKLAYAKRMAPKFGLVITSTSGGTHTPTSYHYRGRAIDVAGSRRDMARYYKAMKRLRPTELFYDPLGGIKYGHEIGAIGGHGDHVHVAF